MKVLWYEKDPYNSNYKRRLWCQSHRDRKVDGKCEGWAEKGWEMLSGIRVVRETVLMDV